MTFLIVIGNWKFHNGHFYRLRPHCNHNGTSKWVMWDRLI